MIEGANDATVERVSASVDDILQTQRRLTACLDRQSQLVDVLITLVGRVSDPTHVTVEEAARLKNCSVKTIRRKIRRGDYTLEQVSGTRLFGIPIVEIYADWIDVRAARTARERQREEPEAKR